MGRISGVERRRRVSNIRPSCVLSVWRVVGQRTGLNEEMANYERDKYKEPFVKLAVTSV